MKSNGKPWIICLIIILLLLTTGAVYWQAAGFQFLQYDDNVYVVDNSRIYDGLTQSNIRWAFTGIVNGNWQPLVWLSYMLDSQISGIDAQSFHLTNLILHIINALLLFLILYNTTGSLWRSSFITAIFALHPLHVESVAWVSERKDVLSTLLLFITIFVYILYVRKPKLWRLALATFFFALGLMAKPMLVTLPLILLLLDFWPLGRLTKSDRNKLPPTSLKQLLIEKIPMFLLTAGICIITVLTQKKGGALQELQMYPFGIRMANAIFSYVVYLRKIIWPNDLAAFYPHPENSLPMWQVIGCIVLLVVITLITLRNTHKRPYLVVGWLWYLITLLPVIGLIQVGIQSMADRYTYMPMVGILIMISWSVYPQIVNERKNKLNIITIGLIAVTAIGALTLLTYRQVSYWRDDITLFEHATKTISNNYVAHNNLGTALSDRGDIEAAIDHYREAVRIKPRYMQAQYNLVTKLYETGQTDEAADCLYTILKLSPNDGIAQMHLGIIYLQQSSFDLAYKYLSAAVKNRPDDAKAHQALGVLFIQKDMLDDAITQLSQAAKLSPNDSGIQARLEYAKSLAIEEADTQKRF